MKKLKLTKVIASTLVVASVLALKPVGASAEWKSNSNGAWWYTEGNSWAKGWRQIDGKWYYFDSDGWMLASTFVNGYRLGSDGAYDGSQVKTNLTKDDFNNCASDLNVGNFIDFTKKKGYTQAYSTIYAGSNADEKFKTYRNIGLGDSLEDIEKAYGFSKGALRTCAVHKFGDELCSNYPKWESLSANSYVDMGYYDDGDKYELRYYLNNSNKVVMIAYFKNTKYLTKNDIKWS